MTTVAGGSNLFETNRHPTLTIQVVMTKLLTSRQRCEAHAIDSAPGSPTATHWKRLAQRAKYLRERNTLLFVNLVGAVGAMPGTYRSAPNTLVGSMPVAMQANWAIAAMPIAT